MKIFISYRRSDSKIFTGRILDRLTQAFGRRSIFRDIEDIAAGKDFRQVLKDAIQEADIMLVMIGPQWANITDGSGNKRLFDPQDFVRFEVETGLKRKDMTVIPVLLLNTAMPAAEELPAELHELLYRNAAVVRDDPDFPTDLQRIIGQIRRIRPWENLLRWAAYALPIAVLLFLAIFAIQRISSLSSTAGRTIPTAEADTPSITAVPTQPGSVQIIKEGIALKAFPVYEQPNTDSLTLSRSRKGDPVSILEANPDETWYKLRLADGTEGWGLAENIQILDSIKVGAGYGVRGDFWEVYFTAPLDNPNPQSHLGIDARVAAAIDGAKTSIDMVMFEMNNAVLVDALLQAAEGGVTVRVVTDDESGLEAGKEAEHSFPDLANAGIPIVADERSALMHDKFIIIDGNTVWTGSYNLTDSSNYDQNNNVLVFHSPQIAQLYEDEFNEMFEQHQFGPKSPPSKTNQLKVDNTDVEVYFTPEDHPFPRILELMKEAKKSIRFMAFTFTDHEIAAEMIAAAQRGVKVEGIIEKVGSNSAASEMGFLYCAGQDIRLDGNPKFLHHKVILIDDQIVITGSANFSINAAESNDENIVIVHDSSLASAYKLEFNRMLGYASMPIDVICETPTP
jgi:phosphatidylserine/phosphatidylglycerophosphate/cardiolipin synthase-like enzyme